MSDPQANQWKSKYLRALDELEQKEAQWSEETALLRRTAGRLVHTGYGIAPQLDRALEQVRRAIKYDKDAKELESLARGAGETAVEVQASQQRLREVLDQELGRLCETAAMDRATQKKASRQLATLKGSDTAAALLSQLPTLLQLTREGSRRCGPIESGAPPDADDIAAPEERNPLRRFFGEKTASTQKETPATTAYEWIFENLLHRLEGCTHIDQRLVSIRDEALACTSGAQAALLLEKISAVLADLQPEPRSAEESSEFRDRAAVRTLHELLQRVEIPAPHQARLDQIKQLLNDPENSANVDRVIKRIAALLESVRNDVLSEKRELESFLEGIADRIQGMTENLLDLERCNSASDDSLSNLEQGFQSRLHTMRGDLQGSTDLQSMKLALEHSLDAMERFTADYVLEGKRSSRDATRQIEDLSRRLHDMKHEAFLLQQQMADERRQAQLDPLTGIFNRLAFDERISSEMQRSRRYQEPLSLLLLDIDLFKNINDNYGHLAGDKVLKALAKLLAKRVRDVDMVARYGGEEFAVLLPNTSLDAASVVAGKVRAFVAGAGFHHNRQPVPVTVSGGISLFRADDDAQSFFQRADDALYAAKKSGRNRIEIESPEPSGD